MALGSDLQTSTGLGEEFTLRPGGIFDPPVLAQWQSQAGLADVAAEQVAVAAEQIAVTDGWPVVQGSQIAQGSHPGLPDRGRAWLGVEFTLPSFEPESAPSKCQGADLGHGSGVVVTSTDGVLPGTGAPQAGRGGCSCGGSCGGKCGGNCKGKGAAGDCGCSKGAATGTPHGVSAGNPWPLDDARHNLVLLAQELLLLEGHLADPERRCPSCVTKHALTVGALADEGRRLDGGSGLTPVWQQASALALSGDVLAVRGLRQGVVGAIVEGTGAASQTGGKAGPGAIPPPMSPTADFGGTGSSTVSVPGKGIGPDSWWSKLSCTNACLGKECGPSSNPFCNCGTCGTDSSGNPKTCKVGKCCGKFECCNCAKPPGAKPNEEGEYWGCDKAAKRCICQNLNEKDAYADNCLAGDGCACPLGTSVRSSAAQRR